MKALYIATIVITAKRKRDKKIIRKENWPLVLNEDGLIPPEDLTSKLRRLVRDHIEFKKFNEWTYEYKIEEYKFSSKIYETN